jgi:hypothetical protein
MKILTNENQPYELDYVPDEIDDIRYGVLDYSDKHNVDYFFVPLVFLEEFNAPAAVLQVGEFETKIPLDWSLIIIDPQVGEPEIIPVTSLNDRGFHAFTLNPISSYLPRFREVEVTNVYQEVKWFFPKLKYGHILAVPLTDKEGSDCMYIVKDTNKVPDLLDVKQLW